ncbi:MAG TPA: sugar phosphate nucleotidyltransferase [Candidatus Binataceae bacterium]|nr:sugar phosphate nucleotidyltransferase [Candidatus Binataceae bacterium]
MKARASAAALIIAGGQGTRFWPLSRTNRPKPLFSLDGRTTLLGDTIARLQPLIARDRIFVITAAAQASLFRRALRKLIPARNLILEPEGRGTGVAIAYGAGVIESRLGAGVIAVMPADHYVAPAAAFRRTLRRAIRLARTHPAIVVIGVRPTHPETGFGYQKIGPAIAGGGFAVDRFVEKPATKLATAMVRSGDFLWNAGMFVMHADTLAAELAQHCALLATVIRELPALSGGKLARAYRRLKVDSFDRTVVEKTRGVIGVRADFRWHDVGSWQGLWEALRGADGNMLSGRVVALDSNGVLARASSRLMVLLGVEDLVAIDAGDAILIAKRSRSQDLRRVIDELRRRGLERYL